MSSNTNIIGVFTNKSDKNRLENVFNYDVYFLILTAFEFESCLIWIVCLIQNIQLFFEFVIWAKTVLNSWNIKFVLYGSILPLQFWTYTTDYRNEWMGELKKEEY